MAFPMVNVPVVHHTWVLDSRGSSGYTRKAISQGKTNGANEICEETLRLRVAIKRSTLIDSFTSGIKTSFQLTTLRLFPSIALRIPSAHNFTRD